MKRRNNYVIIGKVEVIGLKITILDKASLGNDTPFHILEKFGTVEVYERTSCEQIKERVQDSDVIIINKVKITDEVLRDAPKLRLICEFATGYDNIDVESARRRGVAVCNVPAYSTDSVTLITLSTVLSLISHLNVYDKYVKSGAYTEAGVPNKLTPVFHEIRGKVWGIVGYGNIGKSVANVAKAMGAEIIACKRTPSDDVTCVDIDTLCQKSDIITLHCPLNSETKHLINEKRISLMKPDVILVNEARGAVVDEEAVTNAVLSGKIAGFGCDVYSTEPFQKDHPYNKLINLDNVILTPHVAWGAYESRVRCVETIEKNISSFIIGGMLNRVDIKGE